MSTFLNNWLERRAMSQPSSGILIHDWEGVDALDNGYWVDRVGGIKARAVNSPTHDIDGYLLDSNGTPQKYFDFVGVNKLNFGYHYRIIAEFAAEAPFKMNTGIYDFGSWRGADYGIGLFYYPNSNPIYIDQNYKFNNGITYNVKYSPVTLLSNEKYKIVSGCEAYDSQNDVQFIEIAGVKAYGLPHSPINFTVINLNSDGCFGKGARGPTIKMKLYSIKIYNDD